MKLILCIIAAEAMTQLACKAEIFDSLRKRIKGWSKFTNDLLSCPYCVSVWVAALTTCFYFAWEWLYLYVVFLVIHRGSNVAHDLYRLVQNLKIDQILRRK